MTTVETIRNQCKHAQISLHVESKKIFVDFFDHRTTAIYDICTPEGNVLLTGRLAEVKNGLIDMQAYEDGIYHLFIIDGDDIFREAFHLAG